MNGLMSRATSLGLTTITPFLGGESSLHRSPFLHLSCAYQIGAGICDAGYEPSGGGAAA